MLSQFVFVLKVKFKPFCSTREFCCSSRRKTMSLAHEIVVRNFKVNLKWHDGAAVFTCNCNIACIFSKNRVPSSCIRWEILLLRTAKDSGSLGNVQSDVGFHKNGACEVHPRREKHHRPSLLACTCIDRRLNEWCAHKHSIPNCPVLYHTARSPLPRCGSGVFRSIPCHMQPWHMGTVPRTRSGGIWWGFSSHTGQDCKTKDEE